MLLLERKAGERIMLDAGNICITVRQIKGGSVVVGIDAPKTMDIHREEVFKKIYGQCGAVAAEQGTLGSTPAAGAVNHICY